MGLQENGVRDPDAINALDVVFVKLQENTDITYNSKSWKVGIMNQVKFGDTMLAELKDKSQLTIPKPIIKELGLERGDMFDVVIEAGNVILVPVVVYPKAKMEKLEALAAEARAEVASGTAVIYDDVEDLIADLHKAV